MCRAARRNILSDNHNTNLNDPQQRGTKFSHGSERPKPQLPPKK